MTTKERARELKRLRTAITKTRTRASSTTPLAAKLAVLDELKPLQQQLDVVLRTFTTD